MPSPDPEPQPQPDGYPDPFVAPPAAELDHFFDDFEVESLVSQGGMGAVYRAVQTRLDRPVAIKILPAHAGTELGFSARFEDEAKAMAKLRHPNIVSVFDYGETADGSLLYIIMEFVDGANLEDVLRHNGPLAPDQLAHIVTQIGDALSHAHQLGIVHLDVKPANILVADDGTVKVADFGLAQAHHPLTPGHTASATPADTTQTPQPPTMGTPDYAAPERFVPGATTDHRTDLYALAVLTYELLTGEVPRGDWTPPSSKRPGTDRRFDHLIQVGMAHDPDQRFPSVDDFTRELNAIAHAPKLVTAANPRTTTTHRPHHPNPAALASKRRLSRLKKKQSNLTTTLTLLFLAIGIALFIYFFFFSKT